MTPIYGSRPGISSENVLCYLERKEKNPADFDGTSAAWHLKAWTDHLRLAIQFYALLSMDKLLPDDIKQVLEPELPPFTPHARWRRQCP